MKNLREMKDIPEVMYRKSREAIWYDMSQGGELFNRCYVCGHHKDDMETCTHFIRGIENEIDIKEVASWFNQPPEVIEDRVINNTFILPYNATKGVEYLPVKYHGENIAVFPICGGCQALMRIPFATEADVIKMKEMNMDRAIIMTGKAVETGDINEKKCCYLCGRPEGSDSLSVPYNKRTEETLLAKITLRMVTFNTSEEMNIKFKYLVCPECEILLGVSPRIFMSHDGGHLNEDHDPFDLTELNNGIQAILNGNISPTLQAKVLEYIKAAGPEFFINEILTITSKKRKRKKKNGK